MHPCSHDTTPTSPFLSVHRTPPSLLPSLLPSFLPSISLFLCCCHPPSPFFIFFLPCLLSPTHFSCAGPLSLSLSLSLSPSLFLRLSLSCHLFFLHFLVVGVSAPHSSSSSLQIN